MNYPQLIEQEFKKTPNRNLVNKDNESPVEKLGTEEGEISSYEERNGIPYLAQKLDLAVSYNIDNKIADKVRIIDDFIKEAIQKTRDSVVSYQNILDRFTNKMPQSLERMVASKNGNKVLDFILREIAIDAGLSGETFFKQKQKEYKIKQVESLKRQLKELLI